MVSHPGHDKELNRGLVMRTRPHRLTAREVEVLDLAAHGLANRQIAAHLFLSEHTVLGYMKSIFAKLGAHSRVQAVVLAIRARIIEVPDIQISSDAPLPADRVRSDSGGQDGYLSVE